MHKPLPPHNKHADYIEISKSGPKYICVLVSDKRHPVRMFSSKAQCLQFAADNGLDAQCVGGAA